MRPIPFSTKVRIFTPVVVLGMCGLFGAWGFTALFLTLFMSDLLASWLGLLGCAIWLLLLKYTMYEIERWDKQWLEWERQDDELEMRG